MAGAVAALFVVGAAAVGAVVAVGSFIVGGLAVIGTACIGTTIAIGEVLISALVTVGMPIINVVKGIGLIVYDTLAGMVNIAIAIIRLPGALITGELDLALAELAAVIDFEVTALAGAINTGIVGLSLEIAKWTAIAKAALSGSFTKIMGAVAGVNVEVLGDIKEGLETIEDAVNKIREPIDSIMTSSQRVRELVSDIASLKIIEEMLKDVTDITDLLSEAAESETMRNARAIAILTRSIIGTTVATMDKIDAERRLLGATIDTFDERLKTSVTEHVELAKAELLGVVTPRLTTLGTYQTKMNRQMAAIARHLDDVPWFMWMLARALR